MGKPTQKERLRKTSQELAALEVAIIEQQERHSEDRKYLTREAESLRRLIVDMLKEARTLKMRFDWLEEAATEVCTSCEDHQPEAIVRLADEIGLDLAKELN